MAQQSSKTPLKSGKTSGRIDSTDSAAWSIIDAEARARVEKTARLKELRLRKEAEEEQSAHKAKTPERPRKPASSS